MVEQGTWLVPTMAITDGFTRPQPGIAPEHLAKTQGVASRARDMFQMALEMGVRIAAGTDGGDHIAAMGEHARELEIYTELGMNRIAALETATINCAELFGLEGQIGVLTPGAHADIVVLEDNPLEDIYALRRERGIVNVIKDGTDYTGLLGRTFETEPLRVPPMD
jgi:imidazolonepropionase-like amidohydrolase